MVGCCRSFLRDLLNQRSDAAVISEQAVPRLGVAHVHPPQALKRRFRGVIGSALPSGSPRATDRTDTSTPKRAGHGPNPFSQRPIGGCSESSSAGEAGRFQAFYRWCPVLLLSGYEGSPPSAGSGALCCGSKAKEEPPDLPPEPPLLFFQNNCRSPPLPGGEFWGRAICFQPEGRVTRVRCGILGTPYLSRSRIEYGVGESCGALGDSVPRPRLD